MAKAERALPLSATGVAGAGSAQAIESPDPIGVTVGPVGLQAVVADPIDRRDFEGAIRKLPRCRGDSSEEVWFSCASGARAASTQVFEEVIRLMPIIPDHCQLISEDFKPARPHRAILLEQ
jgi:hypothetical protein